MRNKEKLLTFRTRKERFVKINKNNTIRQKNAFKSELILRGETHRFPTRTKKVRNNKIEIFLCIEWNNPFERNHEIFHSFETI